jgi:2,5-diketo-D-gluconate reductase A
MTTSTTPTPIQLNDGNEIPQLGFGVFQIPPEETADAVRTAIEHGYRHIDTAQMYENERGVGEGIRASGVPREEIFVTSKLSNRWHLPDDARRAIEESLSELGIDQLDLFLIHWPLPTRFDGDYVSTWKAMESFKADGLSRSVGVSNFQPDHLERLAAECDLVPAVNQIELHPYGQNSEVADYGRARGIVTEAWSPIAQGEVLDDETIADIAERVDRTPAQVVLRWHIERGNVVFPKSSDSDRTAENFSLFDFDLTNEDLTAIDGLDRGEDGRIGPHPDRFDAVPGDD